MTDNALTLITPGESVRMIEMMATEIDRLRRENAILRQKLKKYMTDEMHMYGPDMTDEEAEALVEKEITWMVLHNEGAE